MQLPRYLLLTYCAIMGLATATAGATDLSSLIPMPRDISYTSGTVQMDPSWQIFLEDTSDVAAAALIGNEAGRSMRVRLNIKISPPDSPGIIFKATPLNQNDPLLYQEQGYTLTITSGTCLIEAPTVQGRFNGANTLRQILRTNAATGMPAVKIRDWPSLKWRGVTDDLTHGRAPLPSNFSRLIQDLAFYKINLYEVRLAADTIENLGNSITTGSRLYPGLDELISLNHQAAMANIQVVFSVDSETPQSTFGKFRSVVEKASEGTSVPYFHLVSQVSTKHASGKADTKTSAELLEELSPDLWLDENLAGVAQAAPLEKHLASTATIVVPISKDAEADVTRVKQLMQSGYANIVMAPSLWTENNIFPNSAKAFREINLAADSARAGKAAGLLGIANSDGHAENLRENNITPYVMLAAAGWENAPLKQEDFLRRYTVSYYGPQGEPIAALERALGWQEYLGENFYESVSKNPITLDNVKQVTLEQMRQLQQQMKMVEESIGSLRETPLVNAEHLDALRLAGRRYNLISDCVIRIDSIASVTAGRQWAEIPAHELHDVQNLIYPVREQCIGIQSDMTRMITRSERVTENNQSSKILAHQLVVLQNLNANMQLPMFRPDLEEMKERVRLGQ